MWPKNYGGDILILLVSEFLPSGKNHDGDYQLDNVQLGNVSVAIKIRYLIHNSTLPQK